MKTPKLAITIILSTLFCATALFAQSPLPMNIPGAAKNVVIQDDSQIEKIVHTSKTSLKSIRLPKPFGETYTLSFWLKLDDSPNLSTSEFNSDSPPTIVEIHAKDVDAQRSSIRVRNGRLSITEIMADGKWKPLNGINMKVEPGTWYHIAYSHSPKEGILYVNGDIVARTRKELAPQNEFQYVTFGRSRSIRHLDGVILQPRLFQETLGREQVEKLCQTPPDEASR